MSTYIYIYTYNVTKMLFANNHEIASSEPRPDVF